MDVLAPSPAGAHGSSRSEEISQRLRRLRLARNLSQRELAGPGVSYAYISRIEAGQRRPSVKAIRVLASKLGVSAEYLERGTEGTMTDDLFAELRGRSNGDPVTITVGEKVVFSWHGPDGEPPRTLEVRGSLTEALLTAVGIEREVEQLAEQEEMLHARRNELLAAVAR